MFVPTVYSLFVDFVVTLLVWCILWHCMFVWVCRRSARLSVLARCAVSLHVFCVLFAVGYTFVGFCFFADGVYVALCYNFFVFPMW